MAQAKAAEVDVVGMPKGGTSKTRLAMFMALLLAEKRKERVLYIEGDTVSQTGSYWFKDAKRSGIELPIELERHPFTDIDELIDEKAGEFDRIVCDIGGGNVPVFHSALTRAHKLLVPIGADPSEVRNLAGAWKAARAAAAESVTGGFDSWVVLSRTDRSSSLRREYRQILTAGEWQGQKLPVYPLTETELVRRVAYQRAYGRMPKDFLDVPRLLVEVGIAKKGELDAC